VSNSTFSGNWAGDGGGGGIENGGTLTVTNSSFSGNHAWVGGGINNFKTLTVTNSTLSNNTVADGNEGGGISSDNSVNASTILENTIVANNGGGNCRGTITNGGSNLDSGTTCGWGSNNGSLSDTDPELGLLAQNGGPTQTMALLAGSPAIDTGNDATCPATDQRGVTRPQGSHCDIGAYESQIEQVPLPSGWLGGVSVTSNKNVVAVGRPHIGNEVASYDGFLSGSTSAYIPMLFKKAFGSYNSALYVQNLHASSTAGITIKYYGAQGNLDCTKTDTIAPLSSKGYWTPAATCDTGSLQDGWTGSVVVTSDQPIVAVARPHIGDEVMTYDGFASGSLTSYIPMLFKGAYGGSYNSAFYIQNVHESNTADITITYYDNTGTLNCTKADTLAPMASKGYWVPSSTCDTGSLPAGWVGGVVVTSDQPIVGVGRPHIGTQITTYNGFPVGGPNAYVPMLFKDAFGGSYDSAFYIQNTDDSNTANITIQYYNNTGTLDCTQTDTLSPLASRGYWLPSATCDTGSLPIGWMGDVIVTSDQPIVSVARPHIGAQVTTYNGFTTGGLSSYLPMLFNKTWGTYNSAFYVQNTENSAATVTLEFYDASGALSCTRTDNIPAFSTLGYWVPGVTCSP
jgi:hypothetical protein